MYSHPSSHSFAATPLRWAWSPGNIDQRYFSLLCPCMTSCKAVKWYCSTLPWCCSVGPRSKGQWSYPKPSINGGGHHAKLLVTFLPEVWTPWIRPCSLQPEGNQPKGKAPVWGLPSSHWHLGAAGRGGSPGHCDPIRKGESQHRFAETWMLGRRCHPLWCWGHFPGKWDILGVGQQPAVEIQMDHSDRKAVS